MTRLSLKQLAQSGAANGQVAGWSSAAGMWVPTTVSGGGSGGGYATGVRQIVSSLSGAVQTITNQIPADATVPQNTEGTQIATVTITPQSATSFLRIDACLGGFVVTVSITPVAAIFRDSAVSALAGSVDQINANLTGDMYFSAIVASGSTAPTTFKLRFGPNAAATIYVNGYPGPTTYLGGVLRTGLIVTEFDL